MAEVLRDAEGKILEGSGGINPWGKTGSPELRLQRRFWKRLEHLAKERNTVEGLVEQSLEALDDKDVDPKLRAELLPRVLGPVVTKHELSGADGGAIEVRSAEAVARLAAEFGEAVAEDETADPRDAESSGSAGAA